MVSWKEKVMKAPIHELPIRWRRPVAWLLMRLAVWADNVERYNYWGSAIYWQTSRAYWENKRLLRLQELLGVVRGYGATAEQLRAGSPRAKASRLKRLIRMLRHYMSASPFAGEYGDALGIGQEQDDAICGKHRQKTYSRSHTLCGCYVWLERHTDVPARWYWVAYHPRRGATATGHTPLSAVRACLRLWRAWWEWDDRAQRGELRGKELAKLNAWHIRQAIKLRGCHPPKKGGRRTDLLAAYRQPQKSLFDLMP